MSAISRTIGAILIIAGTAIGAGMIALPVSTGVYGITATSVIFLTCWLFMTLAALMMLEVNLALPANSNLTRMARATLGWPGVVINWIFYLMLLYALLSAYLSGLATLLAEASASFSHFALTQNESVAIITVLGAITLYAGIAAMDWINRLFMLGLIATFAIMLMGLIPHFEISHLPLQPHSPYLWLCLPLVFTTFGYQIVIPSLRNYLEGYPHLMKKAILIGSLIPLLVYMLWELLILGIIPLEGKDGLIAIHQQGHPEVGLTHALSNLLATNWISKSFAIFAACAIATSFIGVSLSLFDFLKDGFTKTAHNFFLKLILCVCTLLPPSLVAVYFPRAFILALEYAGACVAVLLVILPALMVWRSRYYLKLNSIFRTPGGKIMLLTTLLFGISVFLIELGNILL